MRRFITTVGSSNQQSSFSNLCLQAQFLSPLCGFIPGVSDGGGIPGSTQGLMASGFPASPMGLGFLGHTPQSWSPLQVCFGDGRNARVMALMFSKKDCFLPQKRRNKSLGFRLDFVIKIKTQLWWACLQPQVGLGHLNCRLPTAEGNSIFVGEGRRPYMGAALRGWVCAPKAGGCSVGQ